MENIDVIKRMPLVPLRGLVLFPGMTLHFDVGRKSSIAAVKAASEGRGELFLTMQKDAMLEDPQQEDLYSVGVVAEVKQMIRVHDRPGVLRVAVEGKARARLTTIPKTDPYYTAQVEVLAEDTTLPPEVKRTRKIYETACVYAARNAFASYVQAAEKVTPDVMNAVMTTTGAGALADVIAPNILLPLEDQQQLLETVNVYERIKLLVLILEEETQVLEEEARLHAKVEEQMDKNQREYYLREEMRLISEELGEDVDEADRLLAAIKKSKMPDALKEKLNAEVGRLRRMPSSTPDYNVLCSYIEKCLEIPFGIYTKENKNLTRAAKILDRDHYGLKDVKQRITEMLAAQIVSPELKGQIICLAGPPGVGKTSIAKSVAQATGRKYVRVALGGVHDEAEIRGHRRTYIGSMPGRVIAALIEAGSQNPLILLDEVDKIGQDHRGDPASALLEVLDSEQNFSFKDHYIDMPVDLSRVLFITTANDKYAIPGPLLDRMEVIDLPGYTYEEKVHIAKRHLIPKQMKAHALTKEQLRISDAGLGALIDGYTREAGVRILERRIAALCRKESVRIANGDEGRLTVTEKNLEELLGPKKFRPEDRQRTDMVGVVNGLAWTSVGGELLKVEVLILDGTGKLELTGSLGDVMKESARAAVSFIRSRVSALGIDPDFYKNKDIHIHFPEGAVPKDGPSAGVTVVSAVVSALTGRAARGDVAMTGEITLTGRVLPIGGLREKSMAAYREGIGTVLIPAGNEPDLAEVDPAVKAKVRFLPMRTADEVLSEILLPKKVELTDEAPAAAQPPAPKKPARRPRVKTNEGQPVEPC